MTDKFGHQVGPVSALNMKEFFYGIVMGLFPGSNMLLHYLKMLEEEIISEEKF